ncbi:MAG: hypothetical protein O6950_02315 [Gammaproteobacteria bacterium]|nr:hypothetical protein [Gammaproteobacteria bacterium]
MSPNASKQTSNGMNEFRRCFPGEMISLGFHTLRAVGAPEEIFTLPADEG